MGPLESRTDYANKTKDYTNIRTGGIASGPCIGRESFAGSGTELVEHLGVGLHQANEVLRLEDAEGAEVGTGFGEALQFVVPGEL